MVKIKFLGACREVGRSGVLIESEITHDKVLCDYGTLMEGEQKFPEHVSGKDLSAIVLTHSHIDHCGAIPLFYISGEVPLYTTDLTLRISEVLLRDMLHLSKGYLPFNRAEIYKMRKNTTFLHYGQKKKVGENTWITLYNAGHIPGSAIVLVEMDEKKIVYTGDFNTTTTRLLEGADPLVLPKIDAIITETTYGDKEHSPRKEIEDALVKSVYETLHEHGTVLIPAFGVSRSQEIMLVLNREGDTFFPITVDGMARKVSFIYHNFPQFFRDPQAFEYAMKHCHFINQRDRSMERRHAAQSLGAIVAPSGMLKGGTARYYFSQIMQDPKNTVNLVSYQVEGTPGRTLLDKGVYVPNDEEKPVQIGARVNHYDFSSHVDRVGLIHYLQALQFTGAKRVYCVHGDAEVMDHFTAEIRALGFETIVPLPLDEFTV